MVSNKGLNLDSWDLRTVLIEVTNTQADNLNTFSWWNRFSLRGNYDSRLGRWASTDPYSQYASPYVGMGNNFVNGVDPSGGFFSVGGALVGAVIGGAIMGGVGYMVDRDNWQTWVVAGFVGGGLIGGFTATPLTYAPSQKCKRMDQA